MNYTMKHTIVLFILTAILVISFSATIQSQSVKNRIMKLFIMNDNRERPIITDKEFFWNSKHIDSIIFSGNLYFDLVKYRMSKFKQDSVTINFSVKVAIIFLKDNVCDTIYADSFFNSWIINSKTYTASDDFLERMFNPLYLGIYNDMQKGHF